MLKIRKTDIISVIDKETDREWDKVTFSNLGDTLACIRRETPKGYNWRRKDWIGMTQKELAAIINGNLLPDEDEISVGIISRIENCRNKRGGNVMRLFQMLRGLKLEIVIERKTKRKKRPVRRSA